MSNALKLWQGVLTSFPLRRHRMEFQEAPSLILLVAAIALCLSCYQGCCGVFKTEAVTLDRYVYIHFPSYPYTHSKSRRAL